MTQYTGLVHMAAGNGDTINVLGEELRLLVSAHHTRPALAMMEIVSPPGGGPPALHTHPPMEAFYIIEGTFEFEGSGPDGHGKVRAGAGSTVYVPGGAPHNYKNVGDTPGRMLAVFTEPAPEDFFRALSAATTDAAGKPVFPPDMAKLGAVMADFQVAFVDGPPGPRA